MVPAQNHQQPLLAVLQSRTKARKRNRQRRPLWRYPLLLLRPSRMHHLRFFQEDLTPPPSPLPTPHPRKHHLRSLKSRRRKRREGLLLPQQELQGLPCQTHRLQQATTPTRLRNTPSPWQSVHRSLHHLLPKFREHQFCNPPSLLILMVRGLVWGQVAENNALRARVRLPQARVRRVLPPTQQRVTPG